MQSSLLHLDWLEPHYFGWLAQGVAVTLWLSLLVVIAATLLGLVLAALRASPLWLLRLPAIAWLTLFRNTPLLVQLLFWYFGAASLLPEAAMNWLNSPHVLAQLGPLSLGWPSFEFLAGLLGLTLYSSAFIAEELRAGIRGVARGQFEAATAQGLKPWQVWRFVILPQALRIAQPPLFGQYMNVVKNSSLTMAIGLAELSYASRQVETETLKTFQAFGVATLFYIGIIAVLEVLSRELRNRNRRLTGELR